MSKRQQEAISHQRCNLMCTPDLARVSQILELLAPLLLYSLDERSRTNRWKYFYLLAR